MALVGALGAWLGLSEAFLGAPGLIFKGGYGEVYLLAALFFPRIPNLSLGSRSCLIGQNAAVLAKMLNLLRKLVGRPPMKR
jgi:hypothetical protein